MTVIIGVHHQTRQAAPFFAACEMAPGRRRRRLQPLSLSLIALVELGVFLWAAGLQRGVEVEARDLPSVARAPLKSAGVCRGTFREEFDDALILPSAAWDGLDAIRYALALSALIKILMKLL